jgi:putative SOS response-associated peptidase YedK
VRSLHWEKADRIVERCTIIVTSANDLTKDIHFRMPVILDPAA